MNPNQTDLDRRTFFKLGGAAALGLAAAGCGSSPEVQSGDEEAATAKITHHRRLGRTGFQVSDLSMGCGAIAEANVVRYAYDHGINLFDTAEIYGNGDSETKIGQAMPHLDREKIFIVTKIGIDERPDEQEIIDRFGQCLERMQTTYADALYMHGIADVSLITHEPFHTAVAKLKADGKLKHAGISSHGPRGEEPDSMEKVLGTAAEDGRFDVMLLSYGFMNQEEGERVLQACKEKDIGTTIMKSITGLIEMPVLDPENPSEQVQGWLDYLMGQGSTREEALERIAAHIERQRPEFEQSLAATRPFMEKYDLKTQDELDYASLQWVLRNPDAHTICPSLPNFDLVDKYLPLSGTELSAAGARLLDEYAAAFGTRDCRFGCTDCREACPEALPVSTIMRYAYYYQKHGRQKHAMRKYAGLGSRNAGACLDCHAPCAEACPRGINVQARLFEAHGLLTMA